MLAVGGENCPYGWKAPGGTSLDLSQKRLYFVAKNLCDKVFAFRVECMVIYLWDFRGGGKDKSSPPFNASKMGKGLAPPPPQ